VLSCRSVCRAGRAGSVLRAEDIRERAAAVAVLRGAAALQARSSAACTKTRLLPASHRRTYIHTYTPPYVGGGHPQLRVHGGRGGGCAARPAHEESAGHLRQMLPEGRHGMRITLSLPCLAVD